MGAHWTSDNSLTPPARQVVATAGGPKSEQAQSEGLGQPLLDVLCIKPRTGEGIADKADRRLHPECCEQSGQRFGKAGQGVEQVRQTHEVMVAFHGIPLLGEGVTMANQ